MKTQKHLYSFQFMFRDDNGKLETYWLEGDTPLSKTAALKRGKEYAKQNNMRFYQAIPQQASL